MSKEDERMNRHLIRKLALIVAVALMGISVSQSAWGGFKEGMDAYLRKDYLTAFKELKPVAERGDAEAQYNIAVMYERGLGVVKNYKESVKWLRKAVTKGFPKAQSSLGQRYYYGEGVPQDYKEAVKWFRNAAEQGDAIAQSRLGVMYGQGRGVLKDIVMAYMWWIIASASGDKDSVMFRSFSEKIMSSSEIQEATHLAREWIRKHKR